MVSGLKAFSLAGIQQTRGRRVKESAFYFVPAALRDKIEYPARIGVPRLIYAGFTQEADSVGESLAACESGSAG